MMKAIMNKIGSSSKGKSPTSYRTIKRIVIHTSDSPDDRDIGLAEIREWHVKDNGWSDIGYGYVVRRNGHVEIGRAESIPGAHVAGHNQDTIGIVWVGRNNPTKEQMDTLRKLVRNLMHAYKIPAENVLGHKELFPGKTCPNLDMEVFRASLL